MERLPHYCSEFKQTLPQEIEEAAAATLLKPLTENNFKEVMFELTQLHLTQKDLYKHVMETSNHLPENLSGELFLLGTLTKSRLSRLKDDSQNTPVTESEIHKFAKTSMERGKLVRHRKTINALLEQNQFFVFYEPNIVNYLNDIESHLTKADYSSIALGLSHVDYLLQKRFRI